MIRKNLMKSLSVIMATMLAVMTVACGAKTTTDEAAATETTIEESLVSTPSVSRSDEEAGKVETVYVMADANGAINDVVVSEWLKNATASSEIVDKTELTNIVNVKGSETYTDNGDGTVTWNAGGADIYYQGTTQKALPVSMKITYMLDGKEIAPEDLAGKSGRVTIRFDYTNESKEVVNVNGKDIEVYTPFAMVSGMILDGDKFSNVEISNGKVVSDGGNYVVMGVATPGLKESLGIDDEKLDELEDSEDVEKALADHFEITADTTDFELGMTITMASSDVLSDFGLNDLTDSDKVNEMKDDMADLNDGSTALVDGTKELKDGTKDLKDGTQELADGTKNLKDGTQDLYDGTCTLADGTSALYDGSSQLYSGVKAYTDGALKINEGAAALANGAKSAKEGADKLVKGMQEKDLVNKTAALAAGAKQVSDGINTLADGLGQLNGLTESVKALTAQKMCYDAIAAWLNDPAATLSVPTGISSETFAACLTSLGLPGNVDYCNAWKSKCIDSMTKLGAISKGYYTVVPASAVGEYTVTATSLDNNADNTQEAETGEVTKPSDEAGNGNSASDGAGNGNTSSDEAGNGNTGSDEAGNGNTGSDEAGNGNTGSDAARNGNTGSDGAGNGNTGSDAAGSNNTVSDEEGEEGTEENETAVVDESKLLTATAQETKKVTVKTADGYSQAEFAGYVSNVQDYYKAAGAANGAAKALAGVLENLSKADFSKLNAKDPKSGLTGLQILQAGAATVAEGSATLAAGIKQIYDGSVALDDGLGTLSSGADQLYDGTKTLTANNETLVNGAYSLNDGAGKLNDGAGQLKDGAGKLNDGAGKLNDGVGSLNDGAQALDDGVAKLLDGVIKLDEEGIKKLYEAFDGDLTDFADRMTAISQAASDYTTFAGVEDDVESSVKFIIKTDEIKPTQA